jgi:serine/threonine protein kinase
LARAVAIKTCRQEFDERFQREARVIASLNHRHICSLYDVGPNYLVMELLEGETLAEKLKRGRVSIKQTLLHGGEIADALAAAHAKGVVHRDIKPGNVMIAKAGAGVKVLDFGLAKSSEDENLTGSNVVMGTPAYMAPEQSEGHECDTRTDIYALGLILHEMATGKRCLKGEKPSVEQLPEKLSHVIERCLAVDPDDRWQSAADVRSELLWARNECPGVVSTIAPTPLNDFSPRFGLAYSPGWSNGVLSKLTGGARKTSIRVGAGRFFTSIEGLTVRPRARAASIWECAHFLSIPPRAEWVFQLPAPIRPRRVRDRPGLAPPSGSAGTRLRRCAGRRISVAETIGGIAATVQYAAQAPGEIAG